MVQVFSSKKVLKTFAMNTTHLVMDKVIESIALMNPKTMDVSYLKSSLMKQDLSE